MMRNLFELFEEVTDAMQQLGIDPQDILNDTAGARLKATSVRVVGAHQPRWPLAENISHVKLMNVNGEEDSGEEYEEYEEYDDNINESSELSEVVCWIVLNGHPNDMSPYAPKTCFDNQW
tara:strand:- start:208 stop:567 length:360 start_codon:yes stop_codon:yes gene_type:complete